MAGWKRVLDETDIGTARLIVQLQKQDAAALTYISQNEQVQSDAQFARKVLEAELKVVEGLFPDRALGENLIVKENDAQAVLETAAFSWSFDEYRNRVDQAPPPPPVKLVTCVACTDKVHPNDIVKAPCSHNYCRDCLENLFRSSMKDETLYPPRCCKRPIPIQDAQKVLSRDLRSEFINRREEFETQNKTYCHRPQCSAFIRPYTINGNHAKCSRCRESTCADCKNKWHFGDCPRDEALEQLQAVADGNQWKKCSACNRIVELKHGCNHITCRCKHEFCYICGEQWKTCRCQTWDEARLLARGQRLAPNFMPGAQNQPQQQHPAPAAPAQAPVALHNQAHAVQGLPPVVQPQAAFQQPAYQPAYHQQQAAYQQQQQLAVQQAVQHVRANHACTHDSIGTYSNPGEELECEICGGVFMTWIRQCRRCLMQMCTPCRHNRLHE